MIALTILVMVIAGLWLLAATLGLVFKLTFALVGGVLGVIGALAGLVVGMIGLLIAAPLVLLALLPIGLPTMLLVGLVWLVVRAMRHAPMSKPSPGL